MRPIRRLLLVVLAMLPACGGNDEPAATVDLPVGWEGADPIVVTQEACSGTPLAGDAETVTFLPITGRLGVRYEKAHFRCEQALQGFVRRSESSIDLLVQPVDMNPKSVAACDCLYDVGIVVESLAARSYRVAVYRRWDNLNQPNDPVEVADATVDVP